MAGMACCELMIPVPWGHISARSWNDPCSSPVIAVHGLQDNAGTFDRLIPLLPSPFYYVAIDLPGHGRSSHFPSGTPLDFFDYVTAIKRVVDALGWHKCIYLGHSLGGQIGTFFAALFPKNVSKLIVLDSVVFPVMPSHSIVERQQLLHKKTVDLESKLRNRIPPVYTYDQALQRTMDHRRSKLTLEAAIALMQRSLEPTPGGYRFTTDQRLKLGLRPQMHLGQHLEIIQTITCPHLMVLASESVELFQSQLAGGVIAEAYRQKPNFSYVVVEGNHDVHNNQPERVAPEVAQFLYHVRCSL